MCCERCNKWQHIRCHDQADFIAGRPRRNWELVDFLCASCTARIQFSPYGLVPQQQPQRHHPDSQIWSHYGGNTSNNVLVQRASQPVPSKPTYKQASYEAAPYSNGRAHHTLPQAPAQQAHSTSTQYASRSKSSAMALGQSVYPGSASPQSQALPHSPVSAPTPSRASYASGPNMYLSNYSSSSHSPQNPSQPPQPSSSSHYRPAMPPAQTGAWSQQQVHYSQLATHQSWNGMAHTSGSQPYAASVPQPPVQSSRYYRPHPTAPSTQQYYSGGPNSQS